MDVGYFVPFLVFTCPYILQVFVAEMNKLVKASAVAYEKLLFKEALRNGFFELQRSRDKYRELCGPEGMRKDLVLR